MVQPPNWDLERICPGGPGGPAFRERLAAIRAAQAALRARAEALPGLQADPGGWSEVVRALDPLHHDLGELSSFATCVGAVDSRSSAARAAEAAIDDEMRVASEVMVLLQAALDGASEEAFEAFVARPELAEAGPWLRHQRAGRALRLPPALEQLKVALDREAITGWGRLYDLLAGDLTAELEVRGARRRVGVAEAAALKADGDPEVRRAAQQALESAWGGVKDICAHTLTQVTGHRLQLQERLGIDELARTLHDNRLSRETLSALMEGAATARPALVRYLRWKAGRLGKPALDWWDLDAPLPGAGDPGTFDWGQGSELVVSAFDGFHPRLGAFAREALDRRWIDALPAEGRRPGGFCTDLPRSDESRIFMTYAGSLDNVSTLAHELGHAFHNRVIAGQPATRGKLTSALAETASTFAEAVLRDRVLTGATDPAFRSFMLDQQLQAATAFLMDIPARFAFERRLYALRREGVLDAEGLSAAMVACQSEAYGGALGSWSPLFWCSKLHFYIPEFGFYNWPYTFGYLFSAAVHRRAVAEGPSFLATFEELLRRTGWQQTEELAREVLGADLRDPAFWAEAAAPVVARVDELCGPA